MYTHPSVLGWPCVCVLATPLPTEAIGMAVMAMEDCIQ